ncbi:uncharacterized protein PV09_04975 [Verruconis gallopava]|uniref:Uncharacterized protein n=1 Tax=Verruconis gallopava TaxID=253628 RepID=A0A0D1YSP3_9PEZI|nr:uncharacterized protein PV09_04975 [Verruconis gallopava]KIW03652.1 hypothetical protein PV09_04975 [Verruconis gallopava]
MGPKAKGKSKQIASDSIRSSRIISSSNNAVVPYLGARDLIGRQAYGVDSYAFDIGHGLDFQDYGTLLRHAVAQGDVAVDNQAYLYDYQNNLQQELAIHEQAVGAQEMAHHTQSLAAEAQGAFHEGRTRNNARQALLFEQYKNKFIQEQLESHNRAKNIWASGREQREAERELAEERQKEAQERQRIIDEGRHVAQQARAQKAISKAREERKAIKERRKEFSAIADQVKKEGATLALENAIKETMKAKKAAKKTRNHQTLKIADSSDLVSSFMSGSNPEATLPTSHAHDMPIHQGTLPPNLTPAIVQLPTRRLTNVGQTQSQQMPRNQPATQRMLPAPDPQTPAYPWLVDQMGAMNLGPGASVPTHVFTGAPQMQQSIPGMSDEGSDEDEEEE